MLRRTFHIARRSFGTSHGHGGHGHGGSSSAYGGFHAPHVSNVHKTMGDGMITLMFLWIFYRAKQDGLAVLGIEHPWDAHHEHVHEHHAEWVRDDPFSQPTLKKSGGHH